MGMRIEMWCVCVQCDKLNFMSMFDVMLMCVCLVQGQNFILKQKTRPWWGGSVGGAASSE